MTAKPFPADIRLALALATSICLHVLALLPADRFVARPPPAPPPPLVATLSVPERAAALSTRPETELQSGPQPDASTAVPAAPTFSPTQRPPRELGGDALDAALAALTREEFYPREAIAHGLEGRVVLLLTLDGAGRVVAIDVASGSGHALLDNAAMKAAGRIAVLPGARRQVLLPVEFRLE